MNGGQLSKRSLEKVVSSRYGVPAPTLVSQSGRSSAIAMSRLFSKDYGNGPSKPPEPEDAYLLHVMLQDVESYAVRLKGQRETRASAVRGGVFLASCRQRPVPHLSTPYDLVRIYVPRTALAEHAGVSAGSDAINLQMARQGAPDPALTHLIGALLPVFGAPSERSQLFVDSMSLAIQEHLLQAYGTGDGDSRASSGGLSPWVEKRAKEFIQSRITEGTSLNEVARHCGLSPSHFAKAFRISTGKPPHRWLLERRIESAKSLMKEDGLVLADVARLCGFSDPCHFSRAFSQIANEPPASWRRRNRS
jgi:AraC-like DNA-binding protein